MRIAIITQPLHINYGGLLQNYALQQVLREMGHEVNTINWHTRRLHPLKDWLYIRKRTLLSYIRSDVRKPDYRLTEKERRILSVNTNRFIQRYISLCPVLVTKPSDFGLIDEKYSYDAYIVGSDQVWRPELNLMQTSMFLDFLTRKDVRRIAYAASFGTSQWKFDPDLTEKCASLAKEFDSVSVREKDGVRLCREYLGVDAVHVLDPTMLLDREHYQNLVNAENEPASKGDLFYYILDPDNSKQQLIEYVSSKINFTPFTTLPKYQRENRTRKDVKKHINDCIYPSVTQWVRSFMDAKMVITDSFHGVVFSIIFNKPFWVIGNEGRGNSRFESLLSLFELKDRYIGDLSALEEKWNLPIDWDKVNNIRKREIADSMSFLEKSIQTGQK